MKALILDPQERTANLQDIIQPVPKANEILVKVTAISLNPIDPLYVAHPLATTPRTIGSDFAGHIASLGASVPVSSTLTRGSRVAGFLQGACSVNERPGAFAEYVAIEWDLVWKVPSHVSIEAAASASLVALTAAQGMWYRLGLEAPFAFDREQVLAEHPEWKLREPEPSDEQTFLVYGASTSVGLYAAQMIRLSARVSGKKVRLLGAASRGRWAMLSKGPYAYDALVDYREADWPAQIRTPTMGKGVNYAYDCISEGDTVTKVSSTLAADGRIAIVRSRQGGAWQAPADGFTKEPIYGAVWEALGEEVQYSGFTLPKSAVARSFAVQFYKWFSKVVGDDISLTPIRVMPGGLSRVVEDGFKLLGPGDMGERYVGTEEWMRPVSAEKLVYRI